MVISAAFFSLSLVWHIHLWPLAATKNINTSGESKEKAFESLQYNTNCFSFYFL